MVYHLYKDCWIIIKPVAMRYEDRGNMTLCSICARGRQTSFVEDVKLREKKEEEERKREAEYQKHQAERKTQEVAKEKEYNRKHGWSGVGDYDDVRVGMTQLEVDQLLGSGRTQSRATIGEQEWEQVYYRQKSDYSYVIVVTFMDGKVYSKQEIGN